LFGTKRTPHCGRLTTPKSKSEHSRRFSGSASVSAPPLCASPFSLPSKVTSLGRFVVLRGVSVRCCSHCPATAAAIGNPSQHFTITTYQHWVFRSRGWAGCSVWVAPGGLPGPGMLLGCDVLMQGGGTARLSTYLSPWRPGCRNCKPGRLLNSASGECPLSGRSGNVAGMTRMDPFETWTTKYFCSASNVHIASNPTDVSDIWRTSCCVQVHRLISKPLLEADRDKRHGNGHWRLVFEFIWAWRCPRPLCWKPLQEPALVRSAPASEIG
jgi:hypothetical protein